MKLSVIATAMMAVLITLPATAVTVALAHADCGDPSQPPCAGPVPTADQVVAVLAGLTDPNIPAANKTKIVTPGFSPDEAGPIDDHLYRMNAAGLLPLNFVVTDIQPAPNNFAGATVENTGSFRQRTPAGPIVLVDQGGRWLITHDTAWTALDAYWYNANRPFPGFVPPGK
jgi:hypothetical protein